MTKRRILLKIEIFVLIFAVILGSVTFIMRYKDDQKRLIPFYDSTKQSLDVIFLGSAHTYSSVIPSELYKKFGITSFNYATPGQNFQLIFSCIKEVLEKQQPKLLVIDLFTSLYVCKDIFEVFPHTHTVTDCMSTLSKAKLLNDFFLFDGIFNYKTSFEKFQWKKFKRMI